MKFATKLAKQPSTTFSSSGPASTNPADMTAAEMQRIQGYIGQGEALGKKYFGDGMLGRLEYSPEEQARSNDILEMRKARLAGLSAPEFAAQRSAAYDGLNRGLSTNLRQLRGMQGSTGVRGGAANAQAMNLMNDAQRTRQGLERDIMLKNVDYKNAALSDYENAAAQDIARNLQLRQFNLGQMGKEKYGQLGTGLGYGQLASGVSSGIAQNKLGQDYLDIVGRQLNQAQNSVIPETPGNGSGIDKKIGNWWTTNIRDPFANFGDNVDRSDISSKGWKIL